MPSSNTFFDHPPRRSGDAQPIALAWHDRTLATIGDAEYLLRVPLIGQPSVEVGARLDERLRTDWTEHSPSPGWAIGHVSLTIEARAAAPVLVLSITAEASSTVGWRLDGAGMGRALDEAVRSC